MSGKFKQYKNDFFCDVGKSFKWDKSIIENLKGVKKWTKKI